MTPIAIHLHLYYLSQLPRLLSRLKNLSAAGIKADIFVTLPTAINQNKPAPEYAKAAQTIRQSFPHAVIIPVANRGYDIGAFFAFLHHIKLDKYAYILKIHTKNRSRNRFIYLNHRRMHNALWCDILQESLIAAPEQLQKCLRLLQQNPDAGMVAANYCLTSSPNHYTAMLPEINARLAEMQFLPLTKLTFAAGTMFLARARLFKPLLRYTIADFPLTNAHVRDFTMAHVFERLLSAVIIRQGYEIVGVTAPFKLTLPFALSAVRRFLFQKKRTHSGKLIVKICKIPVFSKLINY